MPPSIGLNSSFSSYDSRSLSLAPSRSSLEDVTNRQFIKTQKSIKKLNAEASKLKAMAAFTKAEAEETVSTEMDTIYEKVDEQRMELEGMYETHRMIKEDIARKEDMITSLEDMFSRRKDELDAADQETLELEQIINELKTEQEICRANYERVEGLVRTMTDSMNHLLAEQDRIIAANQRIEAELKEESARKINLLHSLLETELGFKRESNAIKFIEGKNEHEGRTLSEAVVAQKNTMMKSFKFVDEFSNQSEF